MNEKPRSICARVLDFYLNNRYVVAASSAFCCGLMGFCFGLMIASLCTNVYSITLLIATTVGLGFASLAFIPKLNAKRPGVRSIRDSNSAVASLIGAAIMFSCGATVLGIEGNWNLLVAIASAVLVSLWLTFTPR